MKNSNNLINEKSPYLLQHAHNPVNWFPWGEEAFTKAKNENKPIFLSIGYSTCHWCHVMARESFEDNEVAKILNKYFVNIKVDKEERPDIDTIYMNICQMLTGSSGWPLTIFLTPDQKPFFAGTYFPKYSKFGVPGLIDILIKIKEIWTENHNTVSKSAGKIIDFVNSSSNKSSTFQSTPDKLIDITVTSLKTTFDSTYGGFGDTPKFPSPHNLLFLLKYYEVNKDESLLKMIEKTLTQMYKGGIFDHIGFGFSRYSTDRKWLVPHFEKMLYDNALLTMAYLEAYKITHNELFKKVAEKVMKYVLRELINPDGGFYSAQDADSDGIEGKYYVFTPDEIIKIIGKDDGEKFNKYFDITQEGNFEGKNIPNLIKNNNIDSSMEPHLSKIYEYRIKRTFLHKDDKILISWNSLMVSAFSDAYRILKKEKYLKVAKKTMDFIRKNLCDNDRLFTSFRDGERSNTGFLDDYAFYIYSLINIYQVTLEKNYLNQAVKLLNKTIEDFFDFQNGGFYFTSKHGEKLISRPKETYDGAIPSGNSVMVYNLFFISKITKNLNFEQTLQKQIDFMSKECESYPLGHCFFNLCMLIILHPMKEIVCVLKNPEELPQIKEKLPQNSIITILEKENENYQLLNNQTTYYICENNQCLPPTNII